MSLKRVCDTCMTVLAAGDLIFVDFNFLPEGKDTCQTCYEQKILDRKQACDNLPNETEGVGPTLGYHCYSADELIFPPSLAVSNDPEAKVDFMYHNFNTSAALLQ